MDLSTIVDVLSVVAVVSGLVFAGLELRQFRISRDRESALEVLNTFQTPEFMGGLRAITQLPDDQNKKQVEELLGERMDDVYFLLACLEGLGVLVYKEELSLGLVEDFFAGGIVVTWLKLRRFAEEERKAVDRDTWVEWVQWLAEMVMEREEKRAAVPAYIAHQAWKPS
jgi:hypothetical protein